MDDWERRFSASATLHGGLVAKFQLPDIGCDSSDWWRAKRSGRWGDASSRVLRSASAPATDEQRVMAAVLDASPGAVLHADSTLAWLGLRGFNLADLQVARVRGVSGARANLAQLHELRAVRSHHVFVAHGVATETALRAIWSIASRYSPEPRFEMGFERVGRLLDQAHRLHLVTWAGLHEMVEDIHERGRAGTVLMRALAAERPPGSSPTESRNEEQFEKILANAGLPPMRRQQVVGGFEPIGRADFGDALLPLVTEVNSLSFHTTPTDRVDDERRHRAMVNARFTVAVVWEDDLWSNRSAVVETIVQARRLAAIGHATVLNSPGCPWPRSHPAAPPPP